MFRRICAACAVLALCVGLSLSAQQAPGTESSTYAIGADLSFLPYAEQHGAVFKENGVAKPALEIFREHGYNWVRLRIFHDPKTLPNNLPYTLPEAKQVKAMGFKLLLDFHYSDTWADPGHQPMPEAWLSLTHKQLVHQVFLYTRDTIAAFRDAGVLPDMVQVGNEITNGMLWPDGKLPEHWDNFAQLVQAGINGVYAGTGDHPRPRIMIHIDRGGDIAGTRNFFDKLATYHVRFDVIGQSYYPWWQGSLNDLRANLNFMIRRYGKDVYVVETAYNWEPGNYLHRPGPFPETPEGQREFLEELNRVVMNAPEGRGKGIFWWEPAVTGPLVSRGFFDANGNVLPVIGVFDPFTRH